MNRRQLLGMVLTLALAAPVTFAQRQQTGPGGFYLRNNDTVVFFGDSITEQRLYTLFAEAFVVTRYPELNVKFVHSGWGGDRVTGGGGGPIDVRLERDVIAHQPTVMTVMLGMNDGRYRAFDEEIFRTYSSGYQHIVEAMKKMPRLRGTLILPSPYDDVTRDPQFPGGYNEVLLKYSAFVKDLAERNEMAVADLNTPVVEMLKKAKAIDPQVAEQIVRDRIHPAAGGHLIMAEALLKAWGAKPLVTAVEIDASGKTVARADNTTAEALKVADAITWTQRDRALPFPVDMRVDGLSNTIRRAANTVDLAVKASDFMEALNQQTLKVTGLTGAKYALKINGKAVGSFTREQLAAGLNLAAMATPMTEQAGRALMLTGKRIDTYHSHWRDLRLAGLTSLAPEMKALEDALAGQQRSAAQPPVCFYELAPE